MKWMIEPYEFKHGLGMNKVYYQVPTVVIQAYKNKYFITNIMKILKSRNW